MRERMAKELELLNRGYGNIEHDEEVTWIVIERLMLPAGWAPAETRVLVLVPDGYPATPPDNFAIELAVTPPDGGELGNQVGESEHAGRRWRVLSWHVENGAEGWRPHAILEQGDNLLSFLLGVQERLGEGA
jgi:hypothetical protein